METAKSVADFDVRSVDLREAHAEDVHKEEGS